MSKKKHIIKLSREERTYLAERVCQLTGESAPGVYTKNVPELHGQSVPGQRSQFQNFNSDHE
jgi:hypothetical protein